LKAWLIASQPYTPTQVFEGNPDDTRQAAMTKELPEELFHDIGRHIDCRATLAALCQVSKKFRDIFTQMLYKVVWLDRCDFQSIASISRLPQNSRLSFTEKLRIGKRIHINPADRYEPAIAAMNALLQKMTKLRTFTYTYLRSIIWILADDAQN
jgi:hypothetical protein